MAVETKGLRGDEGGERALRLDRTLCIEDGAAECADLEAIELVEPLRLRSERTSLCDVCSSSCEMLSSSSSTSI